MTVSPRRTQAERKTSMIARLQEATIGCLAESGYARSSVARICERAGVSQGALFRHFPTRQALVAATTWEIGRRHVAGILELVAAGPITPESLPGVLIPFLRAAARSEAHAAWHEVMVAARTDEDLREEVRQPLADFEGALLDTIGHLTGSPPSPRVGAIILSILHLFDSEAVTVAIVPNPELEAARLQWAEEVLRGLLLQGSKE